MNNLFKRISALAVLAAVLFAFTACGLGLGAETVTESGIKIVTEAETEAESTAAETTEEKTETETGAEVTETETETETEAVTEAAAIAEDGVYTSKDDVALYIHTYGKLPKNFITKTEAQKLGWSGGGLDGYADGKCIGGDYFGNYEGKLPKKNGRKYTECDIDTLHAKSRGAKRIIFSNDGLIFYTEDHYETFVQLY
jgi:guanyl-specific ribonuclease Sa